jgi:hypothetical protein
VPNQTIGEYSVNEENIQDAVDRTTAIGLFNTARSYWQSAINLEVLSLDVTHPAAPVTFMLCHAIELYLKSYLRGHGSTVADLKKIGHSLSKLSASATGRGLNLDAEGIEVISHIDAEGVAIEARYIVTGFKSAPTNEALANLAEQLDKKVGAALISEGFPIRTTQFKKPASLPQIDEAKDAEEYIEHMTEKDREIIGYLLHRNQRMFEADQSAGHARLLYSRGIVRIAAQHGQVIDAENVPFEIPKHIWDVLVKHKAKFPYDNSGDETHPWRVDWMVR